MRCDLTPVSHSAFRESGEMGLEAADVWGAPQVSWLSTRLHLGRDPGDPETHSTDVALAGRLLLEGPGPTSLS